MERGRRRGRSTLNKYTCTYTFHILPWTGEKRRPRSQENKQSFRHSQSYFPFTSRVSSSRGGGCWVPARRGFTLTIIWDVDKFLLWHWCWFWCWYWPVFKNREMTSSPRVVVVVVVVVMERNWFQLSFPRDFNVRGSDPTADLQITARRFPKTTVHPKDFPPEFYK